MIRPSILLAVAALACLPALSQEKDRQEERDHVRERKAWFMQGRTALGENPAELLERGYRQKLALRTLRQQQEAARMRAGAAGQQASPRREVRVSPTFSSMVWQNMGPRPISSLSYGFTNGRVTAIAVDQSDATGNTVYVAGANGGIWKSTNAASANASQVTWTPVFEQQPTLSIGAIAIQPASNGASSGSVILVASGEANSAGDSYYGMGIFRSTDGGQTWTQARASDNGARSFRGLGFSDIAFSTSDPNLVVANASSSNGTSNGGEVQGGQGRGIYYSNDAGQSWFKATAYEDGTQTLQPEAGSSSGVTFNATTQRFYTVLRFHGVYSSSDGITWTRMANQPGGATFINQSTCPNTPVSFSCPIYRGAMSYVGGAMYLAVTDSAESLNAPAGIYKLQTVSNVDSWTALATNTLAACGDGGGGCGNQQATFNLYLKALPNGDLYFGAVNIFECSTGVDPSCNGWKNLTHVYGCDVNQVHPDQHAIAYSIGNPNVVYFGNDGGLYRTLNSTGLNSTSCNVTLPFDNVNASLGSFSEFVGFSNFADVPEAFVGGLQDNGSILLNPSFAGSNGTSWIEVNGADGGYNAVDPNNPQQVYVSSQNGSIVHCNQGVNCSSFAGFASQASLGGDSLAFYTPFIVDPGASSNLLIGTCRVWRGNGIFTAISGVFSGAASCPANAADPTIALVRTIAAGGAATPSQNASVVYAGMAGGTATNAGHVFVTTNSEGGAATWIDRTGNINPSNYDISSIAVSPFDATGQTAYLTIMGFGKNGHVFKTVNAGVSWTDITGDLPDVPANSIAVDPEPSPTNAAKPKALYLGTDVGVFISTDDGTSWSELGSGLPNVIVTDVKAYVSLGSVPVKKLRIATYGRGVWQMDLPQIGLSFSTNEVNLATVVGTRQARDIVIKNDSALTVNLSSITVSSAYSIDSNDCPLSLTTGASCNVRVGYAPAGAGSDPGSLTVTDDAPASPQQMKLDGSGVDYLLAVQRPIRPSRAGVAGSAAIKAGESAVFTTSAAMAHSGDQVSVPVRFSCDAPATMRCSVQPEQADLAGGPVEVKVTVQTSAAGRALRLRGGAGERTGPGPYSLSVKASVGNTARSVLFPILVR